MSIEQLFITLLGLTCAGLGWFAREIYTAVQKLRHDLSQLEIQLARDYVRHDRLREVMQDAIKPVLESLTEIKQALTNKVDKP